MRQKLLDKIFLLQLWPVAQVVSAIQIRQGCRFDPQSGHIQVSTNECISKWNNTLMFPFLSLSPPILVCLSVSLKSIKNRFILWPNL